jgi:hypothetical protein
LALETLPETKGCRPRLNAWSCSIRLFIQIAIEIGIEIGIEIEPIIAYDGLIPSNKVPPV